MTETEHELRAENERLKKIAINLKVDLNMRDAKIRKLKRQLAEAHEETRQLVVGTQTMNKLQILGESEDDNGQDPRETGQYKNPWENAR